MICKSAVQIIEENVEGIRDIPHTKDNVFFVSYRNFDKRMKNIESSNLKKYGKSRSWVNIGNYFNAAILSYYSDKKLIEINEDRYKRIRKFLTSEKFINNLNEF